MYVIFLLATRLFFKTPWKQNNNIFCLLFISENIIQSLPTVFIPTLNSYFVPTKVSPILGGCVYVCIWMCAGRKTKLVIYLCREITRRGRQRAASGAQCRGPEETPAPERTGDVLYKPADELSMCMKIVVLIYEG